MGKNQLSAGCGSSILVEEQTTVLLAWEKAGRDRIHTDIVRSPLSRKKQGKIEHRCLSCRIGHDA